MKRFAVSLLFAATAATAASTARTAPVELVQRIYDVAGRPDEVVVLREVRRERADGSLDGLRRYKLYRDRTAISSRLERFGHSRVDDGSRVVAVEYLREDTGRDAERLGESVDALFAEAAAPRPSAARFASATIPSSSFEYVYGPPAGAAESGRVERALDHDAAEWRDRAEDAVRRREFERDARRELRRHDERVRFRLSEDIRELGSRTALSAADALERGRRFLSPDSAAAATGPLIERQRFLNEPAQRRQTERADRLAENGDWAGAAKTVVELEGPLSSGLSGTTRRWLETSRTPRALREHGFFAGSALPRFADPGREEGKRAVAALIQAASLSRPRTADGNGRGWLRASSLLVFAAAAAERDGRPGDADSHLNAARAIAAYFAGGSEGDAVTLRREADGGWSIRPADGGAPMAETVESHDGAAATGAALDVLARETRQAVERDRSILEGDTPSARTLRTALKGLGEVMGGSENRGLKAASMFLGLADTAATNSDARELRAMAVLAMDVAIGFMPPVALVKGLYEFSMGRHWLTGQELSTFDRGLALVSVLTLGTAGSLRAFSAVARAVPFSTELRVATGIAKDLAGSLTATGARFSSGALRSMADGALRTITRTAPTAASTEEVVRAIKIQAAGFGARARLLPAARVEVTAIRAGGALEARILSESIDGAWVAFGLGNAALMIESRRAEGKTWSRLREEFSLEPSSAPETVSTVRLREGDRVRLVPSGAADRLEFPGVAEKRNFESPRAAFGADGVFRSH